MALRFPLDMNMNANARWRMIVRSEWRFVLAIVVGAVALGYVTTFFEPVFTRKPAIFAVLPLLMIGLALLVVSLEWAVLALMLFRAGAEIFLASTNVGGASAGALLNLGMLLIAGALLVRRPRLVPGHVYATFLPFLFIALVGCARSPEKVESIKIWLAWLTVASVYWVAVYLVAQGRRVDDLLRIVAIGSLLPTAIGILFVALNRSAPLDPGVAEGDGFRLAGAFAHPNINAFYLILMIALTLYFWAGDRADRKKYAWIWPCYLMLLMALLALTKTRSAWTALVPILLVYGWKFDRRFFWALLVIGPILALSIPSVRDRLIDLQTGNTYANYARLNSFAWRKVLWSSGLSVMHPLSWVWGNGFRSFERDSLTFFPLSGNIEWSAHNVYVQLIYDTGIVGMLSYVWAYVSQLRFAISEWRSDPRAVYLLVAAIGGCLIVGYGDNMLSYLVYNWYLWFVIGLVSAPAVLRAAAARKQRRLARYPVRS